MLVWVSDGDKSNAHKRRYHILPSCFRLRGGVNRNRTTNIVAMNYEESFPYLPCATCAGGRYPELFKPYCGICSTWRACPHNGGMPVKTGVGVTWVWPERFLRHQPLRGPD